jgi:hypothetical protein
MLWRYPKDWSIPFFRKISSGYPWTEDWGLCREFSMDSGNVSWDILELLGTEELILHWPLSEVSDGGLIWGKTFGHSVSHGCYANDNGVIRRPLGEGLHGATCNVVLHFDFISMHPLNSKSNHVLILKDDLPRFVQMIPFSSPDHFVVAEALIDWYKRFCLSQYLVSDQGNHCKDQSLKEFYRILQTNHHFFTTYSPWANGTVEIVCKHLQSTMRSLLSEFWTLPKEWSVLLPVVQSVWITRNRLIAEVSLLWQYSRAFLLHLLYKQSPIQQKRHQERLNCPPKLSWLIATTWDRHWIKCTKWWSPVRRQREREQKTNVGCLKSPCKMARGEITKAKVKLPKQS